MLAEPRRKQRFTSSLTGVRSGKHTWYKEKDNFAFNLLSKMGWSEGQGLGAQKQGDADFIHVHKKNNHHGVGFDSSQFDKLSVHMDTFNSILSGLSSTSMGKMPTNPSKKHTVSLSESKFQDVAQVRRHKLCARRLQNKNLSNKSSKDIEIVLGNFETSANKKPKKKRSDDSITRQENVDELMRCMTSKPSGFCKLPDPESEDDGRNGREKLINGTEEILRKEEKVTEDTSVPTYNSKLSCAQYFEPKTEKKRASMKAGNVFEDSESKEKFQKVYSEKPRSSKKVKPLEFDKTHLSAGSGENTNNFVTPEETSESCSIPDSVNDKKKFSRKFDQKFVEPSNHTPELLQGEETIVEDLGPKLYTSKISYMDYFKLKMEQKRARNKSLDGNDFKELPLSEHSSTEMQCEENDLNRPVYNGENTELAFKKCLEDIELVGIENDNEENVTPKKKRKRKKSNKEVLENIRRFVTADDVIDNENDNSLDLSRSSLKKKLKLAEELTEKVAEMEKKPKKKKKSKNKDRNDEIVSE